MYYAINSSVDRLLSNPSMEKLVRDYSWLTSRFTVTRDVTVDRVFQNRYKRFWALRGLDGNFLARYFGELQELRNTNARAEALVLEVAQRLAQIPRGTRGLANQFSFATKLVHMLDNRSPVLDARVRTFYFLPNPRSLEEFSSVYHFLKEEYQRVLDDHFLDLSIKKFRESFNDRGQERFSDVKVIDSLIWAFVSQLEGENACAETSLRRSLYRTI